MDNRPLRAAVTKELKAASHEFNPASELVELVFHLELQLKRARGALRAAKGLRRVRKTVDVEPIQMPFPPAR